MSADEPGRYVVNYGYKGIGQEWTPPMTEADARELVDRLGRGPNVPDRLRLLLVVEDRSS